MVLFWNETHSCYKGHIYSHSIHIICLCIFSMKTNLSYPSAVCLLLLVTGTSCAIIWVFSSPPQRPMTSDFEGFLYQILSITLFSYLNSWERAGISLFNLSECNVEPPYILSTQTIAVRWCWIGIKYMYRWWVVARIIFLHNQQQTTIDNNKQYIPKIVFTFLYTQLFSNQPYKFWLINCRMNLYFRYVDNILTLFEFQLYTCTLDLCIKIRYK